MSSSQLHQPRRRAPQPSPSLVAMQLQGLELTTKDTDLMLSGEVVQCQYTNEDMASQVHSAPVSPAASYLTRASSVYSTESAHSGNSARTTISQILDMYIDIISKIPCDSCLETTVVQPTAYRDTIAPLLQRRFSTEPELKISTTMVETCPIATVSPLKTSKQASQASLNSSYKQAPGFQEFSRNLRDRRADLVSPLTNTSSGCYSQLNLEALSAPSPTTPQLRPFSFVGDEEARLSDYRTVSPLLDRVPSNELPSIDTGTTQETQVNQSERTSGSVCTKFLENPRYVNLHDIPAHKTWPQDSNGSSQSPPSPRAVEPSRFNRHQSTGSRSTDSFVMHPGLGAAVKAMIREKIHRRKEAKEAASILSTASHRYSAMQQQRNDSLVEHRKTSLRNGIEHVLNRISSMESKDDNPTTGQLRRSGKHAAIPLTPYQKYGADIWLAKNKEKRREEHRRDHERRVHRSQEIRSDYRPPKNDMHHAGHRRAYSARTVDVVRSPTTAAKRNGLLAAVENAKHSFTHSSAEKRRDKIKESIVLVGPSQLTIANAQVDEDVLQ